MPSHRAHRRSDRNSRDCCYKPLPSLLRSATLRARNSKTRSGEPCLASFACPYVNEELSPRNFAQMRIKANGRTRKKHRMLRPRFLIVQVAAIEGPTRSQRMLHAVLNRMKCKPNSVPESTLAKRLLMLVYSNAFNSPSMVGINSVTVG